MISHQRVTPSGVCRGTAILFSAGSDVMEISTTVAYFISLYFVLGLIHIFLGVVVLGGCVHYSILFYGSKCVNCMLLQIMFKQKYVIF